MSARSGRPSLDTHGAQHRPLRRRALAVGAAFALAAAVGSCGEGEPVSVPIALVPLGVPAGQCVSALQDHLGTPAQVCLYFEGGACVLVADLDAVTTEGCGAEGECALPSGSWSKYCPEGSPGYDLETEAGQSLPASLFVVAGGLADERPSFCTFGGPEESCNGSMDGEAGTNGCLAKIVSEYVVDAETGALTPKADGAVSLTYSGFLVDELGMWGTTDPLCPSIPEGQCPPENASCSPVDLEILVQGSGSGQVRTLPRGTDCDRASCTDSFPRGREVEIEAKADAGAVVASFSAALGAEDGCRDTFVETTTVASCKVTMNGDGQVTVRFGYELSVGVNGLGSVNGSPGGIDGTDISCAGNQSCSEIYDADVTVTLQATSADPDWEFAQWMGGPCDGSQSPTCVVRMDQAQSATALFGYALTIEMVGVGEVTATPPGQTCTTSPCVLTFGSGQSTTLTANPGPNSVFARWSGACASAGTNPTCDLTLDADQSVAVYFAHQVETSAAPNGTGTVTRNPVGLACPGRTQVQCGAYEDGDSVTFTGTPATDYVFLAWTGCTATPGTNTCSKSITAPGTVEGTFGRQLDLSIAAGLGTVDLTAGVHGTCGAQLATPNTSCAAAYAQGTMLTLTANPASGFAVGPNSWTGCTPRAGNPLLCDVAMDNPRQVSLQFGRSLDLQVAGQGTVTSAPTGIDCGADCAEVFPDGATVTLTATPQGGQAFDAWTGCTPGGNPSVCTVTMNDNKQVTAAFGYAIAVTVDGGGTVTSNPGSINCPGTCREVVAGGTTVTLTATPDAQWAFLQWTGCPSASGNRCTVAANTSANVTAVFGRELTVSLVSPASQGSVTGPGISCGNDCSEVYANGTVVNLTAQPAAGYAVATWLGCSSSNATTCSVSMNNARTVAVAFGPILDVTVTGQGTVNSSPGGISCQSGGAGTCTAAFTQDVVLTAIPDPNWDLLGWSGCTPVAGNPNQCSVAMNQARSVTTQFGRRLQVTVSGSGTVTGTGINCGTDCTEVYAAGASITLTATGQGQSFAG
ncbi:MAG: hypothetical protein KC933_34345, partial [Myxococcales bacterium]|nr:hypothetical protein [Myxococcales bacterium]